MRWGIRLNRHRGGIALIYVIMAMFVICAFISFAVDWGRVQLARTELQRTADSAARYGVTGLSDGTCTSKAIAAAGDNTCDGSTVVITASSVVQGNWDDTKTPQFDSTRGPLNACQVTMTRSIPMAFARVLGFNSKTVTVQSIAILSGQYCFVGLDSVSLAGNGHMDSYDSSVGSYSLTTARANGDVVSNGSINLTGNGSINGDAHPGIGKSVFLSGGGTVTGSTTPLKGTLAHSMSTLPVSYFSVPYINLSSGSYIGGTVGVTTNYYCPGISINNSASINCVGPVKIYCSGSININGGYIKTYQDRPTNLQIFMLNSSAINLGGQANLYAQIYAPQSDFTQTGQADIYGSVIARTLSFGGSWQGGIHLDESIATPGINKAIQIVK